MFVFRSFIVNRKIMTFLINITCNYISGKPSNQTLTKVLNSFLQVKGNQGKINTQGKINELDLRGLGLTSFDLDPPGSSAFDDFRNSVHRLDLSENNLLECQAFFGKWEVLSHLNLSGNGLTTVKKSLFKLPAIYELKLGDNKLRALPKGIVFSPTLLVLHLDNNQLVELPKELEKSSIRSIYLQYNEFESVPTCLCNMNWLTQLNLSHNKKIFEFPLEFGRVNPDINLNLEGMEVG